MTRKHFVISVLALLAFLTVTSFAADSKKIPQRSDIEAKYKWKLEDLYPSQAAWEKDFDALKGSLNSFQPYKGHLGDSPATLRTCLALMDSLASLSSGLYIYAHLKLDEDTRINASQERADRIANLSTQLWQGMAFIEPEILGLGKDKALGMCNKDAGLAVYRFYLQDLFRRHEHILSDKEEELLALADPLAESPRQIFSMIDDADIDYGTVTDSTGQVIALTKERYYKILQSKDRALRRTANRARNRAYLKYLNTLSATLGASLKRDLFLTKARNYPTCLAMSLDSDSIPSEVVTNLISAVNSNLAPLHKWTKLRKRILGYDTLFTYDLDVPLTSRQQPEVPYEEAKKIVLEGLRPLGPDYLKEFRTGLEGGWVDVYETQGKKSGAYQWGTYRKHPYLLLNYNDSRDAIFALAHEMGHALHSVYTDRDEPYAYRWHYLFNSEVASTTNEALLMKHLLRSAKTREEKMNLLTTYIEQIIGTFYTQVWFTEYELAIHQRVEKGEATSPEYFRKAYREIFQKYWGPNLAIDSLNDMGCLRIDHFYRPYYTYKYATSYAAAQMLSQELLEHRPGAVERYRKFLSTGSSKYPMAILKEAGVDLTTPEPYQRTIKLFGELVDEMERMLDEK